MRSLLLLCTLTALAPHELVAQGTTPARFAASGMGVRIDSIFSAFSDVTAPGCAVALSRDGAMVYANGYGSASVEHAVPITPRTRFYAASVSKQFTAYAVALLALDGRLSLDDDVRRWIPEVPDFGATVTVRHLIHHTSGLRDYFGLLGLTGWPADGPITEAAFLDLVSRQRALNFPPGTQHLYSNTGYVLLSILVERVSGRSLREFARARMFEPLDMASTDFRDDHAALVPDRALAYAPVGGGNWRLSVPGFDVVGDGGLYTTVEDLLQWDRHFLSPGDFAATATAVHERGVLADGQSIAYAFGLSHGTYRGTPTIAHGGSYGGYRAYLLRLPEHAAAVATLCNTATANPALLSQRAADVLLEDRLAAATPAAARPQGAQQPQPEPVPPAATTAPRNLMDYAGSYYSEELDVTWRIGVDGDAIVIHRRALTDVRVAWREGDVFAGRPGAMRFIRDDRGRVTAFALDAGRVTGLEFQRTDR